MAKNKKFFITGGGGQLAKEFIRSLDGRGLDYFAPRKNELDITDFDKVRAAVDDCRPDVLINCAAYNHVDSAEEHPERAFSVNSGAVRHLAAVCKKENIFLVHFSSDYVFDGEKNEPYTEEDRPNPLNVYGRSKLEGEEAVRETLENFLIFRLSWVFGNGDQNFLYRLSRRIEGKESLEVASDEVSVPTFTEDVVKAVLPAPEKGLTGTYHLVNGGRCSRYEWAKYYCQRKEIGTEIRPVPSDHFAAKAKRPRFSCMSNGKICAALNISMPSWQDAVDRIVRRQRKENDVSA